MRSMENRPLLTSQSVAAMIISGAVLILLGILGGGRMDVIGLGAALLFGAGLFQTIDNRRTAR
jgi:hypothetical protein